MNEAKFLRATGFPKQTHVIKKFPFNKIEIHLTAAQKKLISEHVAARGIDILAIIQENNTNILKYEDEQVRYDSVQFFRIKLIQLNKATTVYKVFANIMPNPLVVLFTDGLQTKWVFATHEKKKDMMLAVKDLYEIATDVTIDQVEAQFHFDKLKKTDLKVFYISWLEEMLTLEIEVKYNVSKPVTLEKNLLHQLKVMDEKIEYLVNQAKKEKQMNKRIPLQLEVNKLKANKHALIQKESK